MWFDIPIIWVCLIERSGSRGGGAGPSICIPGGGRLCEGARVVGGRLETGCSGYQERVAPESVVGAVLGPVAGPQGRRINAPSPPPQQLEQAQIMDDTRL